jgi:uncharacterized repeat protein (TIGR03803 family)
LAAQFTTLFSFNGSNGNGTFAPLIADANGDLFGTSYETDTVFELQNIGTVAAPIYANAPTTLVSVNGYPDAGLIADANGDLFGTTDYGGAYGYGTVFEIKNTGTAAAPIYATAPTTLATFNGSNGEYLPAGLIVDAHGDLLGTTEFGGAYGDGTVFEIQNIGAVAAPIYTTAPTTLVSFNGSNGAVPHARLIADAKGDLIGTTEDGGGYGTVFEIQNIGTVAAPIYATAPTTLVSFNGSNGDYPQAGLIADANGDLFGTTRLGGAYGYGNVFENWHGCSANLRHRPDHAGHLQRLQWRSYLCWANRRRQRRSVRHNRLWWSVWGRHGVRNPEHRHGGSANLHHRPDHAGQLQRHQ